MNSRTRLKLTLGATVFLVVTTFVSIARGMEGVATTCVAGVMTILSTYIWAETRRPSRGWRPGGDLYGDYQTGDYQAGDYQTGDYHTGNYQADGYRTGSGYTDGDPVDDYRPNDYRAGDYQLGDYLTGNHQAGDYHTGDNHTNAFPPDHPYTQHSTNEPGGKGRQNRRDVQDDYG